MPQNAMTHAAESEAATMQARRVRPTATPSPWASPSPDSIALKLPACARKKVPLAAVVDADAERRHVGARCGLAYLGVSAEVPRDGHAIDAHLPLLP